MKSDWITLEICDSIIVGSTQHCRNCNFFRNVLFCSFENIKHIYIISENVLNVLLIFLQ